MDKTERENFSRKFPLSFKDILKWRPKMRTNRPYILPTRHGLAFLVALFFLFLMALSYGHSMAFAATFFLTSLLMSSALLTHLNLKACSVSQFYMPKVFRQGESQPIQLELLNPTKRNKKEVALYKLGRLKMASSEGVDINSWQSIKTSFFLDDLNVGKHSYRYGELMTSFPLGLFYSWMRFETQGVFYMAPAAIDHVKSGPPLVHEDKEKSEQIPVAKKDVRDEGDFYEHHHFDQNSDSWHRIDWKVFAKKDIFLKKTYAINSGPIHLLDLHCLKELETKKAYEQLSFWLSLCERTGERFSLHLKSVSFINKQGSDDIQQALIALSLEAKEESLDE